MAKQTKSQRIRVLLNQGKSVSEIVKAVKCNRALVYQVKSYDKKKEVKAKKTGKKQKPVNVWEHATVVTTPIPYRTQPLDYAIQKPSLFQRIKNFFLGV